MGSTCRMVCLTVRLIWRSCRRIQSPLLNANERRYGVNSCVSYVSSGAKRTVFFFSSAEECAWDAKGRTCVPPNERAERGTGAERTGTDFGGASGPGRGRSGTSGASSTTELPTDLDRGAWIGIRDGAEPTTPDGREETRDGYEVERTATDLGTGMRVEAAGRETIGRSSQRA